MNQKKEEGKEGGRKDRNLSPSSTGGASVLSAAVNRITREEEGAKDVGRTTYEAQNNTFIFRADLEDPELFSLPIILCRYNYKLLEFSFVFHGEFK